MGLLYSYERELNPGSLIPFPLLEIINEDFLFINLPNSCHYNPRLLYFLPIFSAVYNQEWFILDNLYTKQAVSIQEQVIMARVRYIE